MPPFLCWCTSLRSLPLSPNGPIPAAHGVVSKKDQDACSDLSLIEESSQLQHKHKLGTLFNDTLLPGQMLDTPRGAARVHVVEPDKQKGVPLLEDTLSGSRNGRPGLSAQPPQASALHVPAQLCSGSASFDADYRHGERLTSPVSVSGEATGTSDRTTGDGGGNPTAANRALSALQPDHLDYLRLVLEAPLQRALSRTSGHWRLYKQCPQLNPAACAASNSFDAPTGPMAGAAADRAGQVGDTPARLRSQSGEHSSATGDAAALSSASLALQLLQRELLLATELPRCPQLLRPYRVYSQPSAVHVVYDGVGEYTELYTYIRERQRLPERSCRSILQQVLQALAVLHESRWVHRNVSRETVWVAERQPEPQPEPARSTDAAVTGCTSSGAQAPAIAAPAAAGGPAVTATAAITRLTLPGRGGGDAASSALSDPICSPAGCPGGDRPSPGKAGRRSGDRQAAAGLVWPSSPGDERTSPRGRGAPSGDKAAQRKGRGPRLLARLGGLVHAVQESPKAAGQEASPPLRALLGSAYHLAPEAVSGAGYGRPADIWAAGVLLFMLLTGRPPFAGHNELEVMTRILLAAAETKAAQGCAAERVAPSSGDTATGAAVDQQAVVVCKASMLGGFSNRSVGVASTVSEGGGPGPRRKLADTLQEVVVHGILESCASAACREALAGMLELDPHRRLSAAELLRLPWFAGRE